MYLFSVVISAVKSFFIVATADFVRLKFWDTFNPRPLKHSSIIVQTSVETESVFFSTNWSYYLKINMIVKLIVISLTTSIPIYRRIADVFGEVANNEAIFDRFLCIVSFQCGHSKSWFTWTCLNNSIHQIIDWWNTLFCFIFQ